MNHPHIITQKPRINKFDSKLSSHLIQVYKNHFKELESLSSNVDLLMESTATLLSKITKLFGLVMISENEKSILIDIELVHISSDRILVILALESGLIKNIVLNIFYIDKPSREKIWQ